MGETVAGVRGRASADPAGQERLWALVAQMQGAGGDSPAPFEELYRATRAVVYRSIRGRGIGHLVAEDLTADTYERAFKRVGGLRRAADSPAAWLVTIARNLVADHHRRSYRCTTVLEAEVAPRTPEGRLAYVPSAELAALAFRDAVGLLRAITRLTEPQREVVRLRYLLGLTIAETAERLGKPDGAVKSLTFRATRALARDPEVAAIAGARRRAALA